VQNNFMQLARKDNVDIGYNGAGNEVKVTLTSTRMASLLDCEQSLKEAYGDDVKSMEDGDIPKLVYTQICYPHIKNSIEVSSSASKNASQNMVQTTSSLVLMVARIAQFFYT